MPTVLLKIKADELKPNDCFEVAGVGVRVRYLYWNRGSENIKGRVAIDLHREADPLHPLCDKTFMKLDMYLDEDIEVRRNV